MRLISALTALSPSGQTNLKSVGRRLPSGFDPHPRHSEADRFTDATYAYQGGGRGLSMAEIGVLETLVQQQLQPNVTLLFDASVQTGLSRAKKRGEADRFEAETVSFFERVRQTYLDRAREQPQRFRIIDAEQTLVAVEQQIAGILETLR